MAEADFIIQAKKSSAADVLSKPVNSKALISSIEKALATTA
jgi:FixJ family two-component response regulator